MGPDSCRPAHLNMKRRIAAVAIASGLLPAVFSAAPDEAAKFKARLAPVPIDATMRADVTGGGNAAATLAGRKLSIQGSFEGMRGPATAARLHMGAVTGVRGAAVFDLMVTKAAVGTVSGAFELSPEQVEALQKGRFYIQIHSEKAPEGNLWGWLLR
jgi:CHRD domain